MSTERIIDRVRKMLALARDKGATEGERDNALRMAHATIAKYNLDMAAVEASGKKTISAPEPRDFYTGEFFGRPWARVVAGAVATLFFCEYLFIPHAKAKHTKHLFIGRESNALTAISMSAWLIDSIMREGKRYQRSTHSGNAVYRSFALGAATCVRVRCEALRTATDVPASPVAAPGTGIVLASVYAAEHAANRTLLETRYPKPKTGRSGKHAELDHAAYGYQYGKTLNLDRQLETKSTGRIEK